MAVVTRGAGRWRRREEETKGREIALGSIIIIKEMLMLLLDGVDGGEMALIQGALPKNINYIHQQIRGTRKVLSWSDIIICWGRIFIIIAIFPFARQGKAPTGTGTTSMLNMYIYIYS